VFAATLGMVMLGGLAAGLVLARGEVAQSRTTERSAAAPSVVEPAVAAPAVPAPVAPAPAPAPPGDAGVEAGVEAAPARPPRRDRIARSERTGELAIIVRPWAMIWLNGKPSGQTPFRAAVPVGRYRVRLANDDTGHDEVTTVTVDPDRTATVERTW
jgi:hypothetical protein